MEKKKTPNEAEFLKMVHNREKCSGHEETDPSSKIDVSKDRLAGFYNK